MSDASSSAPEREYVLGTGEDELVRLGFQNAVWRSRTTDLWERAGVRPGMRVLDVGAGPGYAALDLAHLVGPTGSVVAVDESDRFTQHMRRRIAPVSPAPFEVVHRDAHEIDLPEGSIDAAYARWVLCFVRDPERVIERVARSLAPGGVFMAQDYFNYHMMALAPRSEAFERIVPAIRKSWAALGGDADVMGRVPDICARHGLEIRDIRCHARIARPGDLLWQWPETFFANFIPRLIEQGHFTQEEADAFAQEWKRRRADPSSFFCVPPVYEMIAAKPG